VRKCCSARRLCRHHQRALPAALDRAEERVERDHRLPGADVALEQPPHRLRAREVAVDLGDGRLLVGREREPERGAVPRHERAGLAERRGHRVLVARRGHRELERHELLEREPPPRLLGLVRIGGEVDGHDRVAPQRHPELGRQRVEHVARVLRERRPGELPQPRRGHLLARRVHGREVRRRPRLAEVVRAHVEPVAAEPAWQPHRRPRAQLVREPRLVEPRGRDRAARVGDPGREDRPAPRRPAEAHVADDARDHDLLVAEESEIGTSSAGCS
jgi:hypothetical protein